MGLLLTTSPIIDKNKAVDAYLLQSHWMGDAQKRGAFPLMELLNTIDTGILSLSKPLLVPVDEYILRSGQLPAAQDNLFLLLAEKTEYRQDYLEIVHNLMGKGYRFALQGGGYSELNKNIEFLLLGQREMRHSDRKALVRAIKRDNRSIHIVATSVDSYEAFEKAEQDGCDLFSSYFFLEPVAHDGSNRALLPLKANLIRLLNMVRNDEFEFSHVTGIVRQDPALTVSLLRFINSPYIGVRFRVRSIQQAVTLLGQEEVRKWATVAVLRSLGTDRPSELTRLSLIWAKFAERLAMDFDLEEYAPSLFLTGLFALLDIMLDIPMEEALSKMSVSENIRNALLDQESPFSCVLQMIKAYQRAQWSRVAAYVNAYHLDVDSIHQSYMHALEWYSELITRQVKPVRNGDRK